MRERSPRFDVLLVAGEGEKVIKRCITEPHICRNGISRGWIKYKRHDVPIAHREVNGKRRWVGYPYSL